MPIRARALLVKEDGFAMVAVIGVMVVALAFASTAAIAAVNSLQGTVRDEDSKAALAAADAGAATALARQNTIAGSGESSCLEPGVGGVLVSTSPGGDGWCAPVSGSIDGGTYSYQVEPAVDGEIRVVATGNSDDVERRIEVTASNSSPASVFAESSLLGLNSLYMDSSAVAHANAASNGAITLESNSQLCGAASVGIGEAPPDPANHGGEDCAEPSYPVIEAQLSLPAVQQGDVVTNNTNGRLFTEDLISGNANKVDWDPVTRVLELGSNVAVTLGGANYSFCRIKLGSNSTLFVAGGATVRMFFDAPEACGNEQVPLEMASNSQITATSGDPTHISMLFVGSDTISSQILLNSNTQPNNSCSSDFVIYAPKTDISVNSNVTYCGAIAGQSIELASNTVIQASSQSSSFELPGAGPHYVADRFVECTVTSPGATGEGC